MDQSRKPYEGKGSISKQELRAMYNVGRNVMHELLNIHFFEELKAVGYKKDCNIISPKVFKKFIELYGEPL